MANRHVFENEELVAFVMRELRWSGLVYDSAVDMRTEMNIPTISQSITRVALDKKVPRSHVVSAIKSLAGF